MKREYMSYEEYLVNVKKGIVTRDGNCPVTPLLLMLQGRWKAQLMYEMCIYDTVRFGQLRKDLPGITNTMLTKALRELEEDGLISRKQFNEIPPHVEYSLTEMGRDLLPVFYAIMNWAVKIRFQRTAETAKNRESLTTPCFCQRGLFHVTWERFCREPRSAHRHTHNCRWRAS